jgi:hypothetical protein
MSLEHVSWTGENMKSTLKTLGLAALVSILLISPFMVMEVVNRQQFQEGFPVALFACMWLNLFAILLILLPLLQAGRQRKLDALDKQDRGTAKGTTLLTNPRSTALVSAGLLLFIGIIWTLESIHWAPLQLFINGPDPAQFYLPSVLIGLFLFSAVAAAGIIAAGPIVKTLRAGGRFFAHSLHWILVLIPLAGFVIGLISFIIDQWPCFIGVPLCDQ